MIPQEGLILDALVGTGFKGQAGGVLAEVIERANSAKLPILSIDIPSGLCGNTGRVGTVAIVATETLYLELPKIGFFLREGWEHVGRLVRGQFGLPAEYMDLAEEEAFLVEEAKDLLPPVRKTRNKYEAGYVLTLAGSEDFVGAGLLASYAALRSGAGIVRWFYPAEAQMGASFAPWELIKEPLEGLGVQRILEEMQRASSLIIGPGIGRDKESFKRAKAVLLKCTIPVVIDADALFFLSKHPSFPLPKNSLLTPHQGELKRLLEAESLPTEEWISSSRLLADKKEVHILVKGAPNFLFVPRSSPYILPCGNPGLATAGTGDVLAGVLGALLAQKLSCFEAAILGCLLHGIAGDEACKEKTSFCMVATDVLESLPKAFSNFL
jgi:NAD(P)H-hydrate epimerase